MSSKIKFLVVLGALCGTVVGCGLHTGEDPPKPRAAAYKGTGFNCVGRIPEHLHKYVRDELSVHEISEFTRCLQNAFTSFAQFTRGRDRAKYRPQEIRAFLHKYFFVERRISDGLMREVMVIKRAVLGGEADWVTRAELATAVEILEDVRREAVRMKPFLRYLNPYLAVQQDPETLGENLAGASRAFEQSLGVFVSRLNKSSSDYPFANMAALIRESRKFVKWEEHFKDAGLVEDWIKFFKAYKNLILRSGNPDAVGASEWAPALTSAAEWYMTYVQFEVGVKGRPLTRGLGLQNIIHTMSKVFGLLDQILIGKPDLALEFAQFDDLLEAASRLNWVPGWLRLDTAKNFIRAMVTKVLGADRFNRAALSRMEDQFWSWAYVQMAIEQRYRFQLAEGDLAEPRIPSLRVNSVSGVSPRADAGGLSGADWQDFMRVKEEIHPLYLEGETRVLLVPHEARAGLGANHSFHNLSMMNALRSVVRLLFRGYAVAAGERGGWDASITRDELQAAFVDFRALGVDLGMLDRRVESDPSMMRTGSQVFTQGNLFTYSSNGMSGPDEEPNSLNVAETMEVLAFIQSGASMARALHEEFSRRCKVGRIDENNGLRMLERDCVRRELMDVVGANVPNMPGLKSYLISATPETFTEFADVLMEMSCPLRPGMDPQWLEPGQLTTLAVSLHYAEAIMTRYDLDRDGLLTNSEMEAAVPIFRGFIKDYAAKNLGKSLWDWEARGALYYIIINKDISKGLGVWKTAAWTSNVVLDRLELAKVFRVIIGYITGDASRAPAPVVQPSPVLKQ